MTTTAPWGRHDVNRVHDVYLRDRVAGTTVRVSEPVPGSRARNGYSGLGSVSDDGRYVAYSSGAGNQVPGDPGGRSGVFVRDLLLGTTLQADLEADGARPADGEQGSGVLGVSLSADGRTVAFDSDADRLVAGDTNGTSDVFVRDLTAGTTRG